MITITTMKLLNENSQISEIAPPPPLKDETYTHTKTKRWSSPFPVQQGSSLKSNIVSQGIIDEPIKIKIVYTDAIKDLFLLPHLRENTAFHICDLLHVQRAESYVCHAARGEALRKSLLVYSCLFSFHTK
jgi:hypothetical protein